MSRPVADDLGNLATRTLAIVMKYRGGRVPVPGVHDARGAACEQNDFDRDTRAVDRLMPMRMRVLVRAYCSCKQIPHSLTLSDVHGVVRQWATLRVERFFHRRHAVRRLGVACAAP